MFEKQFGAQSKETNRKQMNGPFSEEKKDAYIHISQPHTYIQHIHIKTKTHTPTRVRAGSLRLILYIKRICNLLIIY